MALLIEQGPLFLVQSKATNWLCIQIFPDWVILISRGKPFCVSLFNFSKQAHAKVQTWLKLSKA